jgi:hypothetical protein
VLFPGLSVSLATESAELQVGLRSSNSQGGKERHSGLTDLRGDTESAGERNTRAQRLHGETNLQKRCDQVERRERKAVGIALSQLEKSHYALWRSFHRVCLISPPCAGVVVAFEGHRRGGRQERHQRKRARGRELVRCGGGSPASRTESSEPFSKQQSIGGGRVAPPPLSHLFLPLLLLHSLKDVRRLSTSTQ